MKETYEKKSHNTLVGIIIIVIVVVLGVIYFIRESKNNTDITVNDFSIEENNITSQNNTSTETQKQEISTPTSTINTPPVSNTNTIEAIEKDLEATSFAELNELNLLLNDI